MVSFTYITPCGFPGDIVASPNTVVSAIYFASSMYPVAFGTFYKLVNGYAEAIQSGDAVSVLVGVVVRNAPSIAGDLGQTFSSGTPNQGAVQGGVNAGFVVVEVETLLGNPIKGHPVYIYLTVGSASQPVGTLTTAATDGATLIPNVVFFTSGVDQNSNTVIQVGYQI